MGTIIKESRKKGVVFRAEVRREGKRLTKRFARKTDASDWIAGIETAVVRGEPVPKLKRYTAGDAMDKYIREILPLKKADTQKFQKVQLEWFKARLKDLKLCDLSAAELSSAREELRAEDIKKREKDPPLHRSPSTLNRYFQPLMHCLRLACDEWGWIAVVPHFKKLKENPARTEYFSPAEIKAVLAKIESQAALHLALEKRKDRRFSELMNLTIAKTALFTGARLGEICKLRWPNVNLIEGTVHLPGEDTKTGQDRDIPLPESLKNILIGWKQEREQWAARFPSDYLFPALRPSKKGYRSDFASKVFRKAAKDLGIKGKTFHDIRHTAATWATRQQTPTRTVQALLGHSKISTTERYSHVMVEAQREAVDGIEAMMDGTVGKGKETVH